ncbi:MAG: hypothetical protein HOP09_02545 [Hyphomicrobium sp.]|nr:hypothetical protein [Hyphomicrobium sp.]
MRNLLAQNHHPKPTGKRSRNLRAGRLTEQWQRRSSVGDAQQTTFASAAMQSLWGNVMIKWTKIRRFLYYLAPFPGIARCSVCGCKSINHPRKVCPRNRDVYPECLYTRKMPNCHAGNAPIPLLIVSIAWECIMILFFYSLVIKPLFLN